jgi:hypothetical protein
MITGKQTVEYLKRNTALLSLIDCGEYDLLLNAVEDSYRGYIVIALCDAGLLEDKMSYTVYQSDVGVKTMLCKEGQPELLVKWATKNIGKEKYWYITHDMTGEIVWINEDES